MRCVSFCLRLRLVSMKLFTPLQLGPYTLTHRVVMAPLTRMRASEGEKSAGRDERAVLRPARHQGRLHHCRSLASDRKRRRCAAYARHSFGRADGWMAQGRGCGACQGRHHLSATLACRPHLAFLAPAEWRPARRAIGRTTRRRRDHRAVQARALSRAARVGDIGNSWDRGRLRASRGRAPNRPASTAWRFTARTAICWSSFCW